jgi:hypothetical protein
MTDMANLVANHTDFKTIFQPFQETHSKEIELVWVSLVNYLYHNQGELITFKNGGFFKIMETIKNRLRMNKAVFPELKDKVLEFWVDYNSGEDIDDPWMDEDGEEGRRYQCGECNSPFTLGVVLCGEEPVKYECNGCYEKKKEGKYICKDCGCDFTNAEWFDGDYCGDDESDFEGYECYDCNEKKN